MNIFGNCTCSGCGLETRFLLETEGTEQFVLLGDEVGIPEPIAGEVECDYCQFTFCVHAIVVDGVLSAFLNEAEYRIFQEGNKRIPKALPKAGLEKERNQDLIQFHYTFYTPFEQQPFHPDKPLQLDGQRWTILSIHKKEGIERDLARRLIHPTLDEYWYELENEEQQRKWCVVTDSRPDRMTLPVGASKLSEAIQNTQFQDEFFTFQLPVQEEAIEERDHNAILLMEAPYLRENERSHDVTDSLFQTTCMFEHPIGAHIYVKAYAYLSGIRYYVYNADGELEMDVFGETAEEAMNQVQENYSISTDEQ